MNVLILADMDDLHWKQGRGQADLILSCGDLFDQVILEAAEAFACPMILAVKGNHDRQDPFSPPIIDLHLQAKEVGGLKFGGLNGSWRYKPGPFHYEQRQVHSSLSDFPAVDVFLSHNSPKGIHEVDETIHQGFEGLLAYVAKVQPRLLIHGHQHQNQETRIGRTSILGVYGHRLLSL